MRKKGNFYHWSYEGVEYPRILSGGVIAKTENEAREKVLRTLNEKNLTGILKISLES